MVTESAPVAGDAVAALPAKWRRTAEKLRELNTDIGNAEAASMCNDAKELEAALAQDRTPVAGDAASADKAVAETGAALCDATGWASLPPDQIIRDMQTMRASMDAPPFVPAADPVLEARRALCEAIASQPAAASLTDGQIIDLANAAFRDCKGGSLARKDNDLFYLRTVRAALAQQQGAAGSPNDTKKEYPVCDRCGSPNVSADAAARWDHESQDWTVTNVFDKGHSCDDCGDECRIEWKEGNPPEEDVPPPSVEETETALLLVSDTDADAERISTWTDEQRTLAYDWAMALHYKASDNPRVKVPPRPHFIPHLCKICRTEKCCPGHDNCGGPDCIPF